AAVYALHSDALSPVKWPLAVVAGYALTGTCDGARFTGCLRFPIADDLSATMLRLSAPRCCAFGCSEEPQVSLGTAPSRSVQRAMDSIRSRSRLVHVSSHSRS